MAKTGRPHSLRWAMENKDGVTCYVYAPNEPKHMLSAGYTNIRRAGYFDHDKNEVVDSDLSPYPEKDWK